MANDEPEGLLSRVARLVRAGSGPAASASAGGAAALSREAMKEMLERRRRNDLIRKREFDALRKLRRNEAGASGLGSQHGALVHSALLALPTHAPEAPDARAMTLLKIGEIEEQMADQLRPVKRPAGEPSGGARAVFVPTDYPTTTAGLPGELRSGSTRMQPLAGDAPVARPLEAEQQSRIEAAAILFAGGDAAQAQASLQRSMAPGAPCAQHEGAWRALLDLHRVTGQQAAFEALAAEFQARLGGTPPAWRDLRSAASPSATAGALQLSGSLAGDMGHVLQALDRASQGVRQVRISCAQLERIDFVAAGSLLNWVIAQKLAQREVHLVDVHRMVAAFFQMVGISDRATVELRAD